MNRKNKTTVNIGDLKWKDRLRNEKVAESDIGKAAALEDFFSHLYIQLKLIMILNFFYPELRTGLDTIRCVT